MIADVMMAKAETVLVDDDLEEVLDRMASSDLPAIVALDGTSFAGVITRVDVQRAIEDGADTETVTVRAIAMDEQRHCRMRDDDATALATMDATSSDWLAVFDEADALQGLVERGKLQGHGAGARPRPNPALGGASDQDSENPGLSVHDMEPKLTD